MTSNWLISTRSTSWMRSQKISIQLCDSVIPIWPKCTSQLSVVEKLFKWKAGFAWSNSPSGEIFKDATFSSDKGTTGQTFDFYRESRYLHPSFWTQVSSGWEGKQMGEACSLPSSRGLASKKHMNGSCANLAVEVKEWGLHREVGHGGFCGHFYFTFTPEGLRTGRQTNRNLLLSPKDLWGK